MSEVQEKIPTRSRRRGAGAGEGRRRFSFELVDPIRQAGRPVGRVSLMIAEIAQVLAIGAEPVVDSDGKVDLKRCRRWVAELGDITPQAARSLTDRDLLRLAVDVEKSVSYAREAVVRGPLTAVTKLSRPFRLVSGSSVDEICLRPPVFSDFQQAGWPPFVRVVAIGHGVHTANVDWAGLCGWIARLSGLEIEDVRRLPVTDAIALALAVDLAAARMEPLVRAPS